MINKNNIDLFFFLNIQLTLVGYYKDVVIINLPQITLHNR